MDEETKKKWSEEANKILKDRIDYLQKYYPVVRHAFQNDYDWPDLDTLRYEICICIMLGLFQAAITLTNHFMESLLKDALITKDSKTDTPNDAAKNGQSINSLADHFAKAIKKYDNANLGDDINRAFILELITEDQKEQLHDFRKKFRNAYSHSNKKQTFGDLTVPMQVVQIEFDGLHFDQAYEPLVADMPIVQGIIQAIQAEAHAPKYFLYMDDLARQIRVKLFGPIESV